MGNIRLTDNLSIVLMEEAMLQDMVVATAVDMDISHKSFTVNRNVKDPVWGEWPLLEVPVYLVV